jgi:hypothetical protein
MLDAFDFTGDEANLEEYFNKMKDNALSALSEI